MDYLSDKALDLVFQYFLARRENPCTMGLKSIFCV